MVRLEEAFSGKLTAITDIPWSSLGTKEDGVILAKAPMQITNTIKPQSISFALRMHSSTFLTYLPSILSNHALKLWISLPTGPLISSLWSCFFKSNAQRAGVKDNATTAESNMDTDTVIANCLYNSPTIPPVNAVGTNTAASTNAIATTGPDTSLIAR